MSKRMLTAHFDEGYIRRELAAAGNPFGRQQLARCLFYLDVQCGTRDDPQGMEADYAAKLVGVPEYGARVEIEWDQGDDGSFFDEGHLIGIPGREDTADMAGVVHVSRPANPGGIGDVSPEWITLWELMVNPYVKRVTMTPWQKTSPPPSSAPSAGSALKSPSARSAP